MQLTFLTPENMLKIELNPFTDLETPRLKLRQVRNSDAPEILFFRSDATIMRYLDREKLQTLADAETYIAGLDQAIAENNGINWGICPQNSDKLIGTIGLWRFIKPNHRGEIGYSLHPDLWGQGLMREALQIVLNYGFEKLNLHSVEANINPENNASRKLLEKLGFVQEAHFKEDYYFQGKFLDSVIFSLLNPAHRNQ